MEVRGDDGAQWGEDDHDGDADLEKTPGVLLHPSLRHHLSPVKSYQADEELFSAMEKYSFTYNIAEMAKYMILESSAPLRRAPRVVS